MSQWGPEETEACRILARLALVEDLERAGDVTSNALLSPYLTGEANFVARSIGVVSGLSAIPMVYDMIDPAVKFHALIDDGSRVGPGDSLATVRGPVRAILTGERTALNFLQHLSGVATQTTQYVQAVAGLNCQILDTRKTTPGWRRLEKYAVRCGGGRNHRMGLFDGVLIKDNHFAAFPTSIADMVSICRKSTGSDLLIELEVDTLEQLEQAFVARPDIVLLDNMDVSTLAEAVRRRNLVAPTIILEASGGVTLANVRAIAETGVDFISVGALTHSAPALDIALDYSWKSA